MSIHFHTLTVKDLRRETDDCVSICFHIPDHLQDTFIFQQGQYITLRHTIDGEDLRRSYSICSSPLDGELRIAVKKTGRFSSYANHILQIGDALEVMPPMGKFFTPLDPLHQKQYLGMAAGSGITPLLSIISTTLQLEPLSSFTLVYGNRNKHSIIFREALEALKNRYMNRFRVIYILSRERTDAAIHHGRIDAEKCAALCEKIISLATIDECFLCGPENLIFSVKEQLEKMGMPTPQIHFELFTVPGQTHVLTPQKLPLTTAISSKITVKLDGISFDFDLPSNGMAILDAALQQGADLPFACKGGVCCTCRAKLVEGEVAMDVNYGLEADEIEQGFILTCQSHPRTSKVVVDFDVK